MSVIDYMIMAFALFAIYHLIKQEEVQDKLNIQNQAMHKSIQNYMDHNTQTAKAHHQELMNQGSVIRHMDKRITQLENERKD